MKRLLMVVVTVSMLALTGCEMLGLSKKACTKAKPATEAPAKTPAKTS